MSSVQRAALLVAIGAVIVVRPVHADPSDQRPVRLEYSAHEGCPDSLGFFSRVRARTQRVRLASSDELAEVATVSIVRGEGESIGTLELPPLDNHPFSRRVEASSCDEVVLALSLVLALAYDPDAITTFPDVVTTPAAPLPVAPYPPPPSPVSVEPLAAPAPASGAAAGITALGVAGIAPELRAVLGPFIEYGSNSTKLVRPRVLATLLVAVPDDQVQVRGPRTATLRFFGGQLTGCPIWARVVQGVTVAPCLGFDVGEILGSGGTGIDAPRNGTLLWMALEAIARVRGTVAGPVFAEVVGSGGVTLSRGQFQLIGSAPVTPVYKIPAGFGSFGVGLGVHFP